MAKRVSREVVEKVVEADPRTHCQPLAEQRHRRAHALEFQAPRLNGGEKTLTLVIQLRIFLSCAS